MSEYKCLPVVSDSLRGHGLYNPWNSPGQNTGVGSLSLFQAIFPTQGSNLSLPHCRQILYQLSHQGSPRILEWVAFPFSRGFSQPRNQIQVSHIAGRFLTGSPGKPKNTGVGSLSLLWGNFLTQELKRGLLYYRRILNQLSYQRIGKPRNCV